MLIKYDCPGGPTVRKMNEQLTRGETERGESGQFSILGNRDRGGEKTEGPFENEKG
jgi:hypothetical protein